MIHYPLTKDACIKLSIINISPCPLVPIYPCNFRLSQYLKETLGGLRFDDDEFCACLAQREMKNILEKMNYEDAKKVMQLQIITN